MEFCQHQSICGGCQLTHLDYEQELAQKRENFQNLLRGLGFQRQFKILSEGGRGHRVRADFTRLQGKTGFFQKDSRETFQLVRCEHWTKELQNAYEKLQKIDWPFQKSSFRLRVHSQMEQGLWLDLSNIDIKAMLESRPLAENLLQSFSRVEVGQRFKTLAITDRPRLLELPPETWFETSFRNQVIPLKTYIGGFTQPSLIYNRMITEQIANWIKPLKVENTLELGAGIGNLSFPLLTYSNRLTAFENSTPALNGFHASIESLEQDTKSDLQNRLKIVQGNFQSTSVAPTELLGSHFDLIFCNPPRSGLMGFLAPVIKFQPQYLIYMSCYPESMEKDLSVLKSNYGILEASLVDQFPRSHHYEAMILLERI